MPDRISGTSEESERMPDGMSEYMSGRMPDKMFEYMSGRMPDRNVRIYVR